MSDFKHTPVMLNECIEGLNIKKDGTYLDCTLGGGGHSLEIVKKLGKGRLIANDRDGEAIKAASERLKAYSDKITFIKDDYKNILKNLDGLGVGLLDGILIDMGLSSYQIDNRERGFSYSKDAPLDMRMDSDSPFSAKDVINGYAEDELIRIFREYGEERFAGRIAAKIVREREKEEIVTTGRLSEIICSCYPRYHNEGHPAKRVFQSVRIEVNGELYGLYEAVYGMIRRLKSGGRMAVITFHSLEDRIIKNCFKEAEADCICDKSLPICVCGKKQEIKILTKKPKTAAENELKDNKRAESAKLRIIEKI